MDAQIKDLETTKTDADSKLQQADRDLTEMNAQINDLAETKENLERAA